jgi:CubicO group peptidase (beta-lactamase class C family)
MMKRRPKLRIVLGLCAILVIAAIDAMVWTWPWPFNVAVSQLHDRRSMANPSAVLIPVERVAGAYVPLPRADTAFCAPNFPASTALADQLESYALLVWHRGKIIVEHYGSDAGAESRPNSASMHKTVLGLLIGSAIDDGALPGLEAPLGDYIADWANDPRGRITLGQTLQMATGLAPLSATGGIFSEYQRFVYGLWPEPLVLKRPLNVTPGAVFHYFNLNSQLAGMVLQRAVGQRYADYLSEKLWRPLGAKDAYVWPYMSGDRMARTYSSLFARAEDWLRIGIMLKDHGRFHGRQVVPGEWIETMLRPSPLNPNFGLNIWRASPYIAQRRYDSSLNNTVILTGQAWTDPDMFFLDGAGGQRVYVSRAEDLVIVHTGNTYEGWQDTLLPNTVIAELRGDPSPMADAREIPDEGGLFVRAANALGPRCPQPQSTDERLGK